MISSLLIWRKSSTQRLKQWQNSSVLINEKTLPNVSWEGIPFFNDSSFVNHASFALPNVSMATQLSAPQIDAQSVIKKMSMSLCRFRLSMRGSSMDSKCEMMDVVGIEGFLSH